MEHLGAGNIKHCNVFEEGSATHVVTGLLYGAQAFFVFDREVSSNENHQEVQGNLQACIKKIPLISDEGEASLKMTENEKQQSNKFSCTFHGDFALDSNPISYLDAIKVYSELPRLLGKNGEHAVPITVWLYPLNKLDSAAAKLVREISVSLVRRARRIIDDLDDAVMQCQDLMNGDMANQFPEIKAKLRKFKDFCSEYKVVFQKQVCKLLPSIRGGGTEEQELVTLLNNVDRSPFHHGLVSAFLNDQEKEMTVLRSYLGIMKETPVFSSSNDLIKEMFNSANDYVLVFAFSSIAQEDLYLSDIQKFLKDLSTNTDKEIFYKPTSPKTEQWFCGSVAAIISQNIQRFLEFKEANRERDNTAFCIASIPNKNIMGSSIHVYEKGQQLSSAFELPSKPPVPSVLHAEHDCIHLEIKPPAHGSSSVESYIISYQTAEGSEWSHVNTESNSLQVTIKDLEPNTQYRFSCKAVCCPGESLPSDETQLTKTRPCSPPGPPKEKCLESAAITITWAIPSSVGEQAEVIEYNTEYREHTPEGKGKPWLSMKSTRRECTLKGLKSETAYMIRVSANCADAGMSLPGAVTVLTTLKPSDKPKQASPETSSQLFLKESFLLEKGNPTVHGLKLRNRYNETEGVNLRVFGRKVEASKNKVILLLGATGSGKTTLINAMINYILGVKWEDTYRFKLINEVTHRSQAESQTVKVTSYELYNQPGFQIPYSLTIVDTPGFGDTRGIDADKRITEQIKSLLCSPLGIKHIDAVCFVIQASLARLSATQKYIFDSVLSIFGKDIAENILILVTFADGKDIQALEAIKAAEMPCHKTKKGQPTYFGYNNSALYAQKTVSCESDSESDEDNDDNDKRNEMAWNSTFKKMKAFFKTLEEIESRDLTLTVQVLEERDRLFKAMQALNPQIQAGLSKMAEIESKKQLLKNEDEKMKQSENFEKEIEVVKAVRTAVNSFSMNCSNCLFTCHSTCFLPLEDDKRTCAVIDDKGNCVMCPGSCTHYAHLLEKATWKYVKTKEKITVKELMENFNKARSTFMSTKDVLDELDQDLNAIRGKLSNLMADSEIIELSGLGRPFQLGMLYDCRRDALIPGITLWDSDRLTKHINSRAQPNTHFKIIASDSTEDKTEALNVTASLEASFLSGLVNVKGSAEYLSDKKKSKRQSRVTMKYRTTTRFEQLTMEHLGAGNIKHCNVFEEGSATHVVTGLLYGAQAFFVFDREVSSNENHQEVQGNLQACIKKIPLISVEGEASLKMTENEKQQTNKFSCTFHGDFALKSNPVSYLDAIKVYSELPQLLGENGEHAVPITVWLYPLNKLDSAAAKLVREISVSLVRRVRRIIDDLDDAVMQCQDLMNGDMASQFPEIKAKLRKFKDFCSEYKVVFQKQVCKLLPSIRGGGTEEQELATLLNNVDRSPFHHGLMSVYLNDQEKEMTVLRSYLGIMKETPVFSSSNDLIKEVFNSANDYVLVFAFSSIAQEDLYLSDIEKFLKDLSTNTDKEIFYKPTSPKTEQWFCGSVAAITWQKIQRFLEFKGANRERDNTAFCIASIPNKNITGSSIHVYEKGQQLSSEFELPSKPPLPSVFHAEHDCIHLEIKPPAHGSSSVESYIISYQTAEGSEWSHVNTESNSLQVTIKELEPNTQYRFSCKAVCCPGVSLPSNKTQLIKTRPCSPPGPPKEICLESAAITITWDIPTSVGEQAEVIEYNTEYREHTPKGEGKPWLSMKSTRRECTLKGLKSETAYMIRVSANCADAGMSLPSPVTVLTTLNPSDKPKQASETRSQLFLKECLCLKKGKPADSGLSEFALPLKPPVPSVLRAEHDCIHLEIKPPLHGSSSVESYIISYQTAEEYREHTLVGKGKPWLSMKSTRRECTLKGLKSETAYMIRVSANCADAGMSLPSAVTVLTTLKPFDKPKQASPETRSQLFLKESILLEKGNPTVHGLKLRNRYNETEGVNLRVFGRKVEASKNKVILLLGETGSGKTTLINAMINYILGVKWEDTYRFKLINEVTHRSQAESQTVKVTSYELYNQPGFQIPYSLTIVDTPGFGDTRGIDADKRITEQIKSLLCSPLGIKHIDAVCFVIRASLARLSATQKYIFDSVLSIFGKDIAENILILVTFADGRDIPALEAIRAAQMPCHKTKKGQPTYFSFNNSALYAQKMVPCDSDSESEEDNDDNDKRNEMVWNSTLKKFKFFFKTLEEIESRDLTLTVQVLEERDRLFKAMQALNPQIQAGLSKMAEIESTKQLLKNEDEKMQQNENSKIEIDVVKAVRNADHSYFMNCSNCFFTCHSNCFLPQEDDIRTCAVIDANGRCVMCPGSCIYSAHLLEKATWTYVTTKEKTTVKELNFNKAKTTFMTTKDILDALDQELNAIRCKLSNLVNVSLKRLWRLDELALKPRSMSAPEYFDILIKTEEDERKPGFKDRIVRLQKMKEDCNLDKIADGADASIT
ncbi:hypothetical protein NFI96_027085 [Prochilodus magdalenae]|nr:hypothetical protein NFI96_027085 [Prochilodus magdalenae]